MKFFNFSANKFAMATLLAFGAIVYPLYKGQANMSVAKSLQVLSLGMNTCMNRLFQTHSALLTGSIDSNFLENNFRDTTNECFREVSNTFNQIDASFNKDVHSHLDKLLSDQYWYDQKIVKLKSLLISEEASLKDSNITQKYFDLTQTKNDLAYLFSTKVKELSLQLDSLLVISTLSATFLLFTIVGFAISLKKKQSRVEKLNREVKEMLEDKNIDFEYFKKLASKVLRNVGAFDIAKAIMRKKNTFEQETLQSPLVSSIQATPTSSDELRKNDLFSFQDTFINSLSSFNSQILSKSINLDMSIDDDFKIEADKDLVAQVIFHALNYCVDKAKDTKLSISTHKVGPISSLKLKLHNSCFNADELDYVNSSKSHSEKVGIDIRLIKELINSFNGQFLISNKVDASKALSISELELIFTDEKQMKVTSSVFKGKKKDLVRQFNLEA